MATSTHLEPAVAGHSIKPSLRERHTVADTILVPALVIVDSMGPSAKQLIVERLQSKGQMVGVNAKK